MSFRFASSILSLCLLSCAGSTPVRETVSRPRIESSLSAAQPWPADALKAAGRTPPKAEPAPKARATPKRQTKVAKVASTEYADEEFPAQDFSGVDTTAPVDSQTDEGPREVEVDGIEGTMSEFDVRVTLENRAADFDRCHDRVGGGGGRIVYRIHILGSGDVGDVKVRSIKSRNRKLVDCYTEVVSSSHFPRPHGGYADVKWTTKVGRSRKRPDNYMFERRHRWDTPAGSSAAR